MARILADLTNTTARGLPVPDMNFALWDFSLAVYARPGIAPLCLELQDVYHADTNVLLWCLWLEQEHKHLSLERLQEARDLVSIWVESRVKPLRQMRRELKKQYGTTDTLVENLRHTIKQAELLAEQQEQWMLQSLAIKWEREISGISSGTNLRAYLIELQIPAHIHHNYLRHLCDATKG